MELVSPAGPVYQAGTLSGNPLAMTAGFWASNSLTPSLYRDAGGLGARLAAGLADAARDAGVALQVNAFGSLLTPFFTDRPCATIASATSADTERLRDVLPRHAARGIYPPPSQFEAWFLSAAHTTKDVERRSRGSRGDAGGR